MGCNQKRVSIRNNKIDMELKKIKTLLTKNGDTKIVIFFLQSFFFKNAALLESNLEFRISRRIKVKVYYYSKIISLSQFQIVSL